MNTLELPNLREGYLELCNWVIRDGHFAKPRDRKTLELEDATFTVEDLTDTLPVSVGRRISLEFAALEALQLIGGVSTPSLLVAVRPEFEQYLEPDWTQWGAYGRRVSTQTNHVVRKLDQDRDSRQAVITLWNPIFDNDEGKADYPCTVALGFRIRKDRLNLSVTMRSNDAWLGVAYDPWQFTQLQWSVANELDVEPGSYTHHAWSLHLYEEHWSKVEDLHLPTNVDPANREAAGVDRVLAQQLLSSHYTAEQVALRGLIPGERWYVSHVLKAWDLWEGWRKENYGLHRD